jgi:hypothetical protein
VKRSDRALTEILQLWASVQSLLLCVWEEGKPIYRASPALDMGTSVPSIVFCFRWERGRVPQDLIHARQMLHH